MRRRLVRALFAFFLLVIACAAVIAALVETGAVDRWAGGFIVKKIESSTGAHAELGAFHFYWLGLRVELDNFTVHGRESAGLPPFFHADQIDAGIHIISLLERKISLRNVDIIRPSVFVRIGQDGKSNIPTPRASGPGKPWRGQLFNLQIGQLMIRDGTLEFNDAKIPFDAEGRNFQFVMNYEARTPGQEAYVGEVGWDHVEIAARRYLPFRSDVNARFTLTRNSVSIDEFRWKLPHTEIEAHGEVRNFKPLDADFHYRASVWLPDLRLILRKPSVPDGQVDFTGNGTYARKQLRTEGHYLAHGLALHFRWFHAGGIDSWGDVDVAHDHLTMPVFEAKALGGGVKGHLEMDFHGLAFRTTAHLAGASVAQVLEAVDNSELPVNTLHWDGSMDVGSVLTWNRDFKDLTARGVSRWSPPAKAAPGMLPTTAQITFDYSMDRRNVILTSSNIATPNSRVIFDGTLGDKESSLQTTVHTSCIADWEDFISYLRGVKTGKAERITGSADWKGNLSGPLTAPTFAGTFETKNARFGRLYWDDITGRMSYSPDEFQLERAIVKRGRSTANIDLQLTLNGKWDFAKKDAWILDAHLDHASTDDLQGLFGTSYPAKAVVTTDFHGSGTRANPVLEGQFQLEQLVAYGIHADRAQGQLTLRHDQIEITNAELFRDGGRVSGNLLYQPSSREIKFQLAGTTIPLGKFRFLQSKALPIAGQLNFKVSGDGPISAPVGRGTVQLTDLQFGSEVLDSFAGRLDSDGRTARLALHSTKTIGKLGGHLQMALSGHYPLTGEFKVDHIDLDPFIMAGLHLKQLTGHSSIDGELRISGEARHAKTIVMQANLSRVILNYEYVKLKNEGPVRLIYRQSEVRIEQAALNGPDTNFHISGDARFSGNRALHLQVTGSINLRLASGLFPELRARGVAQLDTSVGGTFSKPRITGQAKFVNAAAHYGDFSAGLSNVNGNVVFGRSRLLFDNMTAETGGGELTLSGSVAYGQSPVRYEIKATANRVRIRYPQGLSWLLDGNAHLSGTTKGALLSGNVTVRQIVFAPNVDFASLIVSSQTGIAGPPTTSAFLRNLQFDMEADTSQGARIVWAGAHFTAAGGVHVRGTWGHPIILGSIHLLTGEMTFHGNTYRLTRGDVNFSNPFRFDPVLNIEAATTISPYEITLDFTGPASRMQLSYRSDPPLPANDIISLLALGTPGEENALMSSSSAQSQNFGATALLSEAISSQLGGPIERLFGITNFRVDPFLASSLATGGAEQTTAARVTIQKQVTHNLSVTYSTNANSNQQQVIEVDYAIRRNISIVALRDINGIFGINVKFTKHFR